MAMEHRLNNETSSYSSSDNENLTVKPGMMLNMVGVISEENC